MSDHPSHRDERDVVTLRNPIISSPRRQITRPTHINGDLELFDIIRTGSSVESIRPDDVQLGRRPKVLIPRREERAVGVPIG